MSSVEGGCHSAPSRFSQSQNTLSTEFVPFLRHLYSLTSLASSPCLCLTSMLACPREQSLGLASLLPSVTRSDPRPVLWVTVL